MPVEEGPRETVDEKTLYRLAQAGDEDAKATLVERHWNLVWHIVHRFQGRGYDPEDLFQVGAIGLLKAIDRFDSDRGLKFSTYAVPLIMGEIRRFLRDDQPIRVARSLRELGLRIEQVSHLLVQRLGREPSALEIAESLGVDVADITEALEAGRPLSSLNQAVETPGGSEGRLEDSVSDPRVDSDWLEGIALGQAFSALEGREQYILHARFIQGHTQMEVAERLKISQVQVSRIERKALDRLRSALGESDAKS